MIGWSPEVLIDLFRPFVSALVIGGLLALPILAFLKRLGSRQTISEFVPEHAKKQGTPTMGGLIILAGLLAAQVTQVGMGGQGLGFAMVATLGFAIIGFVDDFLLPRLDPSKRGLGWIPKLLLQVLVAGFVPFFGFLAAPSGEAAVQVAAEIFVVLFFVNAFNFSDGMDGLSGTILVFLSGGLIVLGLVCAADVAPAAGVALLGAVIPFLFLNAPPAKVFMGDVGSMPIGALIGISVLDLYRSSDRLDLPLGWTLASLVVLSGVMVAELVPVPLQILSVKLLKRRMFKKTPIHHAYEVDGIPETRIVWGFALAQLICTGIAVGLMLYGHLERVPPGGGR